MNMHITDAEGRASCGFLDKAAGDVVLRLDSAGFVLHASANAHELGIDLQSLLVMPHISDFAEHGYGKIVSRHVHAVLGAPDPGPRDLGVPDLGSRDNAARIQDPAIPSGRIPVTMVRREAGRLQRADISGDMRPAGWIEFPLSDGTSARARRSPRQRRWYALSLRSAAGTSAHAAIALLRPAERHHRMMGQVRAHAAGEPLALRDGRAAFCTSLRPHLGGHSPACVAIFAIDRMQALKLQYGEAAVDEIRWGFARFLEGMARPGQDFAQLSDRRVAIILPGMSMREATAWAEDVLQTFATLASPASSGVQRLSASAGIARAQLNADWTLRQAELGLVMARASGGMRAAARGKPCGLREAGPLPRIMPVTGDEQATQPAHPPYVVRIDRSAA